MVDALADLHRSIRRRSTWRDLGRPDGFVERQVAGWAKRWSWCAPDDAEPLMDGGRRAAGQAMPDLDGVSVLHNDSKLDNCQFDPADPDRVTSVFDWDMATLGDPLVDLGTLLNYWPDPADTDGTPRDHNPGMEELGLPTRGRGRRALRRAHRPRRRRRAAGTRRSPAGRPRVVLQQLHARYLRGESTDERMASRGDRIAGQARRAMAILDTAGGRSRQAARCDNRETLRKVNR